jgi:hypothetical protein
VGHVARMGQMKKAHSGDTRYTRFRYSCFCISTLLFQYYEEHLSYLRPNFKACYLRQNFSRFTRKCDAYDKLSIREYWRQFNIKMVIVIRFPFYAFSLYAAICRNATPVYNECHQYSFSRKTFRRPPVLDSSRSVLGPVAGFCEYGNEAPGFSKRWEIFLAVWVTVSFWRRSLLRGIR